MRAFERSAGGLVATLDPGDPLEVDAVLFATGRGPKTRALGLEDVGVALDANGSVVVDAYSRSNVPSIWAVGDATHRRNLTPVAIHEGHAVARTLFGNAPTLPDHLNVPSAVFSQPPVGTVGLSEEDARAAHPAIDVYRSSFRPLQHALSGRTEQTLVKVVVDRTTQRVVGCHMVGPDAGEIIQGFAVAIRCGLTKPQLDATLGIHPTSAEELVSLRTPLPEPAAG
jgi:glutathione reductase (NADPH)